MTATPDGGSGGLLPIETTRLGGGMSWKVGLAAVSAVLIAIVGIGVAGRPPAPTPRPIAAASDAAASDAAPSTAAASPATGMGIPLLPPTPTTRPVIQPDPRMPADLESVGDHYMAVAFIGPFQYLWKLNYVDARHLTGTFELPVPPPATRGTIELAQVWSTVSHDAWSTVASWDLHLESVSAASGREYVVLDRTIRARPRETDSARPVKNGYQIKVRAESGVMGGRIKIDVTLGSGRNQLVGDDGIFGWPTLAAVRSASRHVPAPRGVYNFCRWDFGPMSLAPAPGTDEANCGA
jgi:hypothetical protein